MITRDRIDEILEEMERRSAYGVIADACELTLAKARLEFLINDIERALVKIEYFARTKIPDPEIELEETER